MDHKRPSGPPASARPGRSPPRSDEPSATLRFRDLDPYRVEREWKRYEGTPQRELFRQLRERFLRRHADRTGRAIEVGPGPGRFSLLVGSSPDRRVLLDLSEVALRHVHNHWGERTSEPPPTLVRGDARRPPFGAGSFEVVVALGNALGFAGEDSGVVLSKCLELLSDGGTIVLETVAGPGERANYLSRLPASAVGRLLRAPLRPIRNRVEREGFRTLPGREETRHGFHRSAEGEIVAAFREHGIEVVESIAVAPVLGADADRVSRVAQDPRAWDHLLELEEEFGRQPGRRSAAAALLIAGVRGPPSRPPKAHG